MEIIQHTLNLLADEMDLAGYVQDILEQFGESAGYKASAAACREVSQTGIVRYGDRDNLFSGTRHYFVRSGLSDALQDICLGQDKKRQQGAFVAFRRGERRRRGARALSIRIPHK